MKKYKHIRLNLYCRENTHNKDTTSFTLVKSEGEDSVIGSILKELVIGSDDWVEEKDNSYQIQSFVRTKLDDKLGFNLSWMPEGSIITRGQGGTTVPNFWYEGSCYCETNLLEHSEAKFNIHSVKRLSDGVVFKLDDKVKIVDNRNDSTFTKLYTINKFVISENLIKVYMVALNGDMSTIADISSLVAMNVAFYDENGEAIYVGDKLISYVDHNWDISTYPIIDYSARLLYERNKWKFFADPKKAQKYVIENKPCLSYNEVKDSIYLIPAKKNNLLTKIADKLGIPL